jgi:peptidoglycan/xylan/chitin deacetylase (PgdA/CDA1 family)
MIKMLRGRMNQKQPSQKKRQNRTLFISILLLGAVGVISIMLILVQMIIAGSEKSPSVISDTILAAETLLVSSSSPAPETISELTSKFLPEPTNAPMLTPTLEPMPQITPTPVYIPTPTSVPTPMPTSITYLTPTPAPLPTVVPTPVIKQITDKIAYLTFDDGPSERTMEITKILTKYDVKATFFVLNKNDERSKQIIKQTAELGHTIGMHGASHNYSSIYKSADAFNRNLDLNDQYIWEITGIHPSIIRFPGGSLTVRNFSRRADIFRAVSDRGYVYFDWNCSSGDSNPKTRAPDVILKNILQTAVGKKNIVVLMHDSSGKRTTVEALPSIIEALRDKGYRLERLTDEVLPVHAFGSTVLYKNPVVRYNSIRYGE